MVMDGEQLAMLGMARADLAASADWKGRWDRAIMLLAILGEPFTTDAVREIAGPPADHPNAAGARLHAAARKGLIRKTGYASSTRPVLHRHPLTTWVGTAKAREAAA